jgi:SAM-dependent methyltransferase
MVDEALVRMTTEEIDPDDFLLGPLDTHWGEEQEGRKLDLACGGNPRWKYTGVDFTSKEDLLTKSIKFQGEEKLPFQFDDYIQHDLLSFPWPFEDSSISAVFSSHFVEHIPHYIPGVSQHATDDGWWHFFAELYRILEPGGIAEFIHPFSRSDRSDWDPTHTRRIHYQTWWYLNEEFRLSLGMDHYVGSIDFEVLNVQTIHEPTLLEGKSADVVEFARQFYYNITDDLFVVLRSNKPE